jgi:hypothetical protein
MPLRDWLHYSPHVAGILAAVVILGTIFVVRSRRIPDVPTRPPVKPGSAAVAAASPPVEGGIDLLDLVDLRHDVVRGYWGFEDRSVVSPAEPYARIQFPIHPPEEYDLRLTVRRKSGDDSLNIGLPAGDKQFLCVIDGGQCSGLEFIGNKPFHDNETSSRGARIKSGSPASVLCSVRKGRVQIQVNGGPVIDWAADYGKVHLQENWAVPDRRAIFIGAWNTVFALDQIVLVPVTGTVQKLR